MASLQFVASDTQDLEALQKAASDPAAINETQTIFRADPLTLVTEDCDGDGEAPVR